MSVFTSFVGPIHCTNVEVKESEDDKVFGDHHYSHKVAHEATTNQMDVKIKVFTGIECYLLS